MNRASYRWGPISGGLVFVLFALFAAGGSSATGAETIELNRFQFTQNRMAVPVRLVLYAADAATANRAAEAVYQKFSHFNQVFSDYDRDSELRRLCRTAGEGGAVPVSDDLWRVMNHAQRLARQTDGAFDVTVGPVVRLWRRARRRSTLPKADRLAEARALVGYDLVELDAEQQAITLKKADMRLDLGGIAKGYAIDAGLEILKEKGISRALIDAGGDIGLGDPPPGAQGWIIGVSPLEPEGKPSTYLCLSNRAVATSGDTWQFVEIDGRRYSHLVDPRTGVGLTDHSSVTVVADDCTTADATASAVSVLGPRKGMELVESTPGAAALIVRAPEDEVETYRSENWDDLPRRPSAPPKRPVR